MYIYNQTIIKNDNPHSVKVGRKKQATYSKKKIVDAIQKRCLQKINDNLMFNLKLGI